MKCPACDLGMVQPRGKGTLWHCEGCGFKAYRNTLDEIHKLIARKARVAYNNGFREGQRAKGRGE